MLAQLARPRAILDLIRSAEEFRFAEPAEGGARAPVAGTCERCGYISSQAVCKACLLLEGLNRGLPGLGVGRTRRSSGLGAGKGEGHGGVKIGAGGSCSKGCDQGEGCSVLEGRAAGGAEIDAG